jgi:hypothetical protein
MSWLEVKYVMLISSRLHRFQKKSGNLFNFRCPFCGDSEQHKNKARAYMFERLGTFRFYCHNCMVSLRYEQFLKKFDSGIYEQFLLEKLEGSDEHILNQHAERLKTEFNNDALNSIMLLTSLPLDSLPYQYILNRKLPDKFISTLYYCETFKAWTNKQLAGKFAKTTPDEPRIIIPMKDKNGGMFGFQGRAILDTPNNLRYISIMLDETKPKIYGLDRVDFNYRFYCLEGPFDSMFLPNAIATAGGKITSELMKCNVNIDNAIVLYDNEPHNQHIVKALRSAVMSNKKVMIWPSSVQHKDLNDLAKAGWSLEKIKEMAEQRTFQGLEAELEFASWSKC